MEYTHVQLGYTELTHQSTATFAIKLYVVEMAGQQQQEEKAGFKTIKDQILGIGNDIISALP